MGLYRRSWKREDGTSVITKTWWMSYIVNGRQRCESTHTTNKREAQKRLDIRRAEIAEGRFSNLVKSHSPRFKAYISAYLSTRRDIHPNTVLRYRVSERSLVEFFGPSRLADITHARIEEYKAKRLADGTGPAGINRDLSLLRLILKRARRERYIAQNPLADREHFLNEQKVRLQARPFTIEEEQRMLGAAPGYMRPLLILLLDTGLRPSAEALPLRWKDVDLERGMVTIVSSKTRAGLRTIPMTTRLKAELLRWNRLTGRKNSEFVFFYPKDPRRHLQHVPKSWARLLKDAKVVKRRIYDCRSTFCSRMYAAGVQPMLVELLMGHAGDSLVHTYAKANDEFKRDAVAKLEAFIASKNPAENTPPASNAWVN